MRWKAVRTGAALAAFALVAPVATAQLSPGPGYQVHYQIDNAFVPAIDRVADTQLAATGFSATQDVKTVALNNGPVGPTIYTQPALPNGSTFGGGFIASDGLYALTGQTGFPADAQGLYPGRVFLTRLSDGATSELNVPGNFDATHSAGHMYLTASAGTSTGLGQNSASGVYRMERAGGTLTGLNLIIDTDAASGLVAGDESGNLVFSIGGSSAPLGGSSNDVYRVTSAQVSAAIVAGPTTGLPASAADKLITGAALSVAAAPFFSAHTPPGGFAFTSISDLIFKPDGDLIVGLSAFLFDQNFNFAGTVGQGMLLDVSNAASDYSATVSGTLYTNDASGGGSLAYRASDHTLWVADGANVYGLAVVPEPATALLLAGLAMTLLGRRFKRCEV